MFADLQGTAGMVRGKDGIILFDPISFCVAIYYCVVYTLLYMLFSIYPIVFQQKRGWNAGVGELPLLGVVVGAILGGVILFLVSIGKRERMSQICWQRFASVLKVLSTLFRIR